MRLLLRNWTFLLILIPAIPMGAQVREESFGVDSDFDTEEPGPNRPCIPAEHYEALDKILSENYQMLGLDQKSTSAMTTKFSWPLRPANGLNDCSYYTVRNYVDQDPAPDSIRDWNCGKRTYDGHRGVDITPYPYWFYKMDHNQVQVVAAAAGTIVARADGNYDRNCVWVTGTPANYIVIRHSDGSTARYFHLKKYSVTAKNLGQTVETGEYLGVVGSSGYSTNPHLHFEVWKTNSSSQFVDPFGGSCNAGNDSTLWVTQQPYLDPGILKVSVNTASPVFPECPETETPNEDSCYPAGGSARFYIFLRDQRGATTANMRILRPDGSVFAAWARTFTSNASRSYWSWSRTLPTETGSYVFEAVYDGEVCAKPFTINCPLTNVRNKEKRSRTILFPNPVSTSTPIGFEPALTDACIQIFNAWGKLVKQVSHFSGSSLPIRDEPLPPGVYSLQIGDNHSGSGPVKLVVTD